MFCASRFLGGEATKFDTVIVLIIGNIIATIINYLIAKRLNKNGNQHTIGGDIPLEKAIVGLGVGVTILAIIILYAD